MAMPLQNNQIQNLQQIEAHVAESILTRCWFSRAVASARLSRTETEAKKTHGSPRRRATTFFDAIMAASILFGLICLNAVSAPAQRIKQPEIAKTIPAWRKSLLRLPQPREGCHTSSFPRVEWKPVACGPPPPYPMHPARGRARHFIVGGGGANDFAGVPNPAGTFISSADGTFVSLSAGITEAGQVNATGGQVANAYSLQLNTNFFVSTACAASPNAGCRGWEQFVYENNNVSRRVFIQYWLIQFNAACPAGWTQFQFPPPDTDIYCFRNSGTASLPAGQPVSNLNTMTLTGAVTATTDSVTITAGANAANVAGINAVAASAGWTDAEYNIFGDAGGGQANFGANTTTTVRTMVHNGTTNAPTCVTESFTGETNNLTLVGMVAIPMQPSPAIEFTQSNVAGAAPGCVVAAGIGDTHLSTFGGLLYDFQASGDFVLAQTDKNFEVQARQVSGAPTWPDASVNKAVATRMGNTRVAVCSDPSRLVVDGNTTDMDNGQILSLPGGVDILRTGNVYLVVDQSGNSMRAEVNDGYINANVGLGHWPANVRGILANVRGNVNKIQARTGMVLTNPFAFDQLYHEFADSWRVLPRESLLSACGDQYVETGIPTRPFYAKDLKPEVYNRARAVCLAAGVKARPWLDACTLDVAVIGKKTAAAVFVGLRTPTATGRVVSSRRYKR